MTDSSAPATRVTLAFAALYVIWGSTYLAIRFAIETVPPFLMAGVRYLIAGAILYVILRARGARRPTRSEWLAATVSGGLMIAGGNGLLTWAEQYVASGIAALLLATVPLWFVGLAWLGPEREAPSPLELAGLLLGLGGVALLVAGSGGHDPAADVGGPAVLWGALAVLAAAGSWAVGSLYHRRARFPGPPLHATAMTMMAGGGVLCVVALATGEPARFDAGAMSSRSLAAFAYLVVFGSIVGFSAYAWLIKTVRPALVGTYAYVNPVVAVLLGWWLGGERITSVMLVGAAIVLASVGLVQSRRLRLSRTRAGTPGRVSA